jgi:L-rhamnose mutarotase
LGGKVFLNKSLRSRVWNSGPTYRMRLKKERVNRYAEVHRKEKIWQSVINGLKKAGFKRMIIYQLGQEIIIFEEAPDLKEAYEFLNDDEESAKWDRMISEWMEEYPQFNRIKGDIEFKEVPVIFYFEDGKLLH